jgi:ubiquinone/menaquinone biosynthesis C-methylase UbiE
MGTLTPEMQAVKARMKDIWSAGDFGVIAKILEPEGKEFIKRLNIPKGAKVLDVACGTGTLAIPAARAGADVTGLDIVADLIRQAKERASAENLNMRFDVGDAEALPYNDNEFDYVVTMFGAMFAPRPDVTASELIRVCKPGGTIAMANWTPEGFAGIMFKHAATYMPAPPPGSSPPTAWGNEETVKQRLNKVSDIKLTKRILRENLQMSPNEATEHFIEFFGPTKTLHASLDEGKRAEYKDSFTKLWAQHNLAKDGTTVVDAEYLEVIARK